MWAPRDWLPEEPNVEGPREDAAEGRPPEDRLDALENFRGMVKFSNNGVGFKTVTLDALTHDERGIAVNRCACCCGETIDGKDKEGLTER